jgi:NAD(P)-dependent dehydrogenase (short-subunit alcohol dehydrogenase family)
MQQREGATRFVQQWVRLLYSTIYRSSVNLACSGVMETPMEQLTEDGYDLQFGTNVLGLFHSFYLHLASHAASARSLLFHKALDTHAYLHSKKLA